MQRIEVCDDMDLYLFPPAGRSNWGFNIYALRDGNDVLLIDSGYEPQAAELLADLTARGLTPRRAVISHFHPDHIYGLRVLPKLEVWGSERYMETVGAFDPPEDAAVMTPSHCITDGETVTFGRFTLRFLLKRGHAASTVHTIINDTYIHIGDDLLATNDGHPILPWLPLDCAGEYAMSLEALKEFADHTILLSHGAEIRGRDAALEEIENRRRYLAAVAASDGHIPYLQAVAGCTRPFLHAEWHDKMYKR